MVGVTFNNRIASRACWSLRCTCTAWFILLITGLGCEAEGPARVAVEGTVTLDGQPLPGGQILLIPTGNHRGPLAGGSIETGKFRIEQIDGPTIGLHRVEIRPEDPLVSAFRQNPQRPKQQLQQQPPASQLTIPERYHRRSTLTAEVIATGENRFHFELTTKP